MCNSYYGYDAAIGGLLSWLCFFYIRGFAPATGSVAQAPKKTQGGIICPAVPEPMSGGGGVYLVEEDFVVSGRVRD